MIRGREGRRRSEEGDSRSVGRAGYCSGCDIKGGCIDDILDDGFDDGE